jgi:hypothetical protein
MLAYAPNKMRLSERIVRRWQIRKKKEGETETVIKNEMPYELKRLGLAAYESDSPTVKDGYIAVGTWKRQSSMYLINPTEKFLKQEGYLPIEEGDKPEAADGYELKASYAEADGKIVIQYYTEKVG